MKNTQTIEHRGGVYHDDIYTLAPLLEKMRKISQPKKLKNPLHKYIGSRLYRMEKHDNDYIDMINITDHDPKIMHALGNVVDLGPRNCVVILLGEKTLPKVFQASVVSY